MTCRYCKEEKEDEEFTFYNKKEGKRNNQCKPCTREISRGYRERNRDKYNAKQREGQRERTDKINAIKLKSGCVDCGYKEHPEALEFDHLPEYEKMFNIGEVKRLSWERIEAEIAKCEVVCANCHRVRTFNRRKEETL